MKNWIIYRRPGKAKVWQEMHICKYRSGMDLILFMFDMYISFAMTSGAEYWTGSISGSCGRGMSEAGSLHHTNKAGTVDVFCVRVQFTFFI